MKKNGRVELTARGSQAKWTKFHSELFRRHPITYQMLSSLLTYHFTQAWSHQLKRCHRHRSTKPNDAKGFTISATILQIAGAVAVVVVSAYCSLVNRGDTCALRTPPHLSRLYLGIMDTLDHGHLFFSHHACWSSVCWRLHHIWLDSRHHGDLEIEMTFGIDLSWFDLVGKISKLRTKFS